MLNGLGEDWIPGYKPAFNFQMTLVDAVARWLALNPDWLGRLPGTRPVDGMREAAQIWIAPPPTLSNQPPPQELDQMLHIARKFDVAGRDERNRAPSAARAKSASWRMSVPPAARCACLVYADVVSGQLSLTVSRIPAPAAYPTAGRRPSRGHKG